MKKELEKNQYCFFLLVKSRESKLEVTGIMREQDGYKKEKMYQEDSHL